MTQVFSTNGDVFFTNGDVFFMNGDVFFTNGDVFFLNGDVFANTAGDAGGETRGGETGGGDSCSVETRGGGTHGPSPGAHTLSYAMPRDADKREGDIYVSNIPPIYQ